MPLRIRLTKLSDQRHRFEIRRDDGSGEAVELETRSFLVHDFIHYAVESEAGLRHSFWGQLAAGKALAELFDGMRQRTPEMVAAAASTEPGITEGVVGIFTGMVLGRATPEEAIEALGRMFEANEVGPPAWLTVDFARRIEDRVRRLRGEWRSVPYGKAMELTFG